MAAYDNLLGSLAPGFDIDYSYQPSPLYSASTVSDLTLVGEYTPPTYPAPEISSPPTKRQRIEPPAKSKKEKITKPMTTVDGSIGDAVEASVPAASKPKRVRTGCLTCRERHLKCDEGLPNCLNCRKSSRVCKRGVRLNFIDTTVKSPPMIPPTADWQGMDKMW